MAAMSPEDARKAQEAFDAIVTSKVEQRGAAYRGFIKVEGEDHPVVILAELVGGNRLKPTAIVWEDFWRGLVVPEQGPPRPILSIEHGKVTAHDIVIPPIQG